MPYEVQRWRHPEGYDGSKAYTDDDLIPMPNGWKCAFVLCEESPFDEEIDALVCERYHIAQVIQQLKRAGSPAQLEEMGRMIEHARRFDEEHPEVLDRFRRRNCEWMTESLEELRGEARERGVVLGAHQYEQIDTALEAARRGAEGDPELDVAEPPRLYLAAERMLRAEIELARRVAGRLG